MKSEKLLLCKEINLTWDLPSWLLDHRESAISFLKRELQLKNNNFKLLFFNLIIINYLYKS